MRGWRAIGRLPALLLVSLLFESTWLLGTGPARLVGRGEAWRRGVFRRWSGCVLAILGVRVETVGAPPRAPFLLVSNHLSYLDVAVFARAMGPVFVAKSEVARWPVIGWLARSMGTLFVDRRRHRDLARVAQAMGEGVARGRGLVLFPEGTSTAGAEVARFRSSLLAPAARGGWDVHHASIRYATAPSDPPARLAIAWWGDMTFAPHLLQLLTLRRIEARIVFGEEPIRDPDRKSLARRLHDAVGGHFVPLRP